MTIFVILFCVRYQNLFPFPMLFVVLHIYIHNQYGNWQGNKICFRCILYIFFNYKMYRKNINLRDHYNIIISKKTYKMFFFFFFRIYKVVQFSLSINIYYKIYKCNKYLVSIYVHLWEFNTKKKNNSNEHVLIYCIFMFTLYRQTARLVH